MSLRFSLLGHPVAHSISPAIHRAAYRELGIDAEYSCVDCPHREALQQQVQRVRSGALAGANVTLPHKSLALELADHADPLARRAGAANVLAPAGAQLLAYNTDVLALVEELRPYAPGSAQAGTRGAFILGGGGAARAALVACQELGLSPVWLSARRLCGPGYEQLELAQQLAGLGAQLLPWQEPGAATWAPALAAPLLLIQTTSAGMLGAAPGSVIAERIDWPRLAPGSVAYDLVYNPTLTPFLQRAREHALEAQGGLGMLVGQAAHALGLWLGRKPARDHLLVAARQAIGPGG